MYIKIHEKLTSNPDRYQSQFHRMKVPVLIKVQSGKQLYYLVEKTNKQAFESYSAGKMFQNSDILYKSPNYREYRHARQEYLWILPSECDECAMTNQEASALHLEKEKHPAAIHSDMVSF